MSTIYDSIINYKSLEKITDKNQIPGWFNFAGAYDHAISISNDGDIWLEIGSFLGCSTAYATTLIKNSGKNIKLYCVDPWIAPQLDDSKLCDHITNDNFYQLFEKGLKDLELFDYIIPIKKTSNDAFEELKNKQFKFILVDGLHDYEHAKFDISTYKHLLTSDGSIAGDDYGFPGVERAVKEEFGTKYTLQGGWPYWLHQKTKY
jgi:predicted O-methyltransferase YrrM